jgi:hypothetical protein
VTATPHRCFVRDNRNEDRELLQITSASLASWPTPLGRPKVRAWTQLYEYFFGVHYALEKALEHEYPKRRLGDFYEDEVRPSLKFLAQEGWAPPPGKEPHFKSWVAGFYLNDAIDRISETWERLSENKQHLEDEGDVTIKNLRIAKDARVTPFDKGDVKDGDELYELVHSYIAKNVLCLLRQDWNYRKHRTQAIAPVLSVIPSGWTQLNALKLRRGADDPDGGPYLLQEDERLARSPLGSLRPRCLWRAIVCGFIELTASISPHQPKAP